MPAVVSLYVCAYTHHPSRQVPTRKLSDHLQRTHNVVSGPFVTPMLECTNPPCRQSFATRAQLSAHIALCLSAPRPCHGCRLVWPCLEALRRHVCAGPARVPVMVGLPYSTHAHEELCRRADNPKPANGWLCTLCKAVNVYGPPETDTFLSRAFCSACGEARCLAFNK